MRGSSTSDGAIERVHVSADEFAALYRDRLTHLASIFLAKGVGREEANDLAQETVLRTLQHLKRHGRTREDIGPLTRTIARNLLVERLRRAGPAIVSLTEEVDAADDAPDPSEMALERERRDAVRAALRSLTPRHGRVIELWMQGRTPADIARELGIKRNAADAILHRARRTLASRLGPKALWAGVAVLWLRFKSASRNAATSLASWSPDSAAFAPAGVSLATVGLAAVLTIASPGVDAAKTASLTDAATASSIAVAPQSTARLPVAPKTAVAGPDEVPEAELKPEEDVAADTEVTNPVDGEPDGIGAGLSYDPDAGRGRGPVDEILDDLLKGN